MEKGNWKKELLSPILITLIVFTAVILIARVYHPTYLLLTLAGVYIIVSNIKTLGTLLKSNPKLSGGAISHIGIGMILIGIMFSSGYSEIVSLNNTGLLYLKQAGTEFNRDNLLLFMNEPRSMAEYDIEFLGERMEPRHKSGFVKKSDIELTEDPFKVVAKKDILFKGKKLYTAKDTFEIYPENTFYEIELSKAGKVEATLFPRVQINPSMGGFLASPDIKRNFGSDLYTHVSAPMDPSSEPDWSKMEEIKVKQGQQFFVNDYVATLQEVKRLDNIQGLELTEEDVAVKAIIQVQGERDTYTAEPIFLIKWRSQVGRIFSEINDLGIKITLLNIHPETNEFSLGLNTRQKDWVIIKAMEKPYINILWVGTGILLIGFSIAMVRRFKEMGNR